MRLVKSGSILFIILGLLWLTGIVGTVLYSIGSQVYAIASVREIQIRSWLALESGLSVGLAQIQAEATAYRQPALISLPYILYKGAWPIDPRHPDWQIELKVLGGKNIDHISIRGILSHEKKAVLILMWHLEYHAEQWFFIAAERVPLE